MASEASTTTFVGTIEGLPIKFLIIDSPGLNPLCGRNAFSIDAGSTPILSLADGSFNTLFL